MVRLQQLATLNSIRATGIVLLWETSAVSATEYQPQFLSRKLLLKPPHVFLR
jgi:hypothetical protein